MLKVLIPVRWPRVVGACMRIRHNGPLLLCDRGLHRRAKLPHCVMNFRAQLIAPAYGVHAYSNLTGRRGQCTFLYLLLTLEKIEVLGDKPTCGSRERR